MAVALIEAASSQTAGLYVPVSRIRPRRDLVARIGLDFCEERGVLPVGEFQGSVVCVTTHTRDAALLRELRQRFGRPVTLRITTQAELHLAFRSIEGVPSDTDRRHALADVLAAMQVVRPEQVPTFAMGAAEDEYLGASLVQARLITEDERLEAIGLAFHLPSIDLDAHTPTADLDALLPVDFIQERRVLPLWAIEDELFVAVDEPPNWETMDAIEGALGLTVRPVLVTPRQLTQHLEGLQQDTTARSVDVAQAVVRAGLVSAAQTDAAQQVARQTGEPLEQALSRLAHVPLEQIRVALALAAGARPYGSSEDIDADAASILPPRLAKRLGAIVIESSGSDARVAMTDPWNARTQRAVAAFLGHKVRPAYIPQAELVAVVDAFTAQRAPRLLRIGDPMRSMRLLAAARFIAPAAAQAVNVDLDMLRPTDLQRVWEVIENDKRSEAVALDALLPRVHQLLLRPDPAAARLRPTGEDAPPILPILLEDDILTVAIASPEYADAARRLAGQYQYALRLAVAREDEIDAARIDLATLDFSAISEAYVAFGRLLEQRYQVRRVHVLNLFRRMQETGEALDVAAIRMQLFEPEELRAAFADYLNTDALSLARTDQLETMPGADGHMVTRRVLHDPVQHDLAARLPLDVALDTGALPIRQHDGAVVVAMADPLDHRAVARVQAILGEAFYVQPATRDDIRGAAQRAHGRTTIGDLLLDADLITREDLERALELTARTGIRLGEALISLGLVSEDQLSEQLANQVGIPFIGIRGAELNRAVGSLLPEEMMRRFQVVPIAQTSDGRVTVAIADPADQRARDEVTRHLDGNVEFVGTTRSDVRDALERLFHEQYLDFSASELIRRSPSESAYRVLSTGQKFFFIGLVIFLVATLWLFPIGTLTVLIAISTFFYLAFSTYKFYLIYRALSHTLEVPVTPEDLAALDDRELPVYTILVPLYKESEILPALVAGLSRLDYPLEKLDVKLLLEEDDTETIRVARASNLPSFFDITIVPHGQPKGKPKACNYGLLHAHGEYVVIFDAEDIPEPDQLKKVLVAFRRSADHVVCVQAKLNYFNRNQNALTKWFTTEYSTWFDLFLPGLDAAGAPIPLGGTSNHFRIDALRRVGGWDPFNVTEDADLGLRIFKMGGATVVVDSTTFEEANSVVDNWIRQRSRWVKGYIQTYLVHMRNPLLLWRQLGPAGFLSFQLVIGGTFFGFLLNPLLWGLTGIWFITKWGVIQEIFPTPIYYMGSVSLYVGNFAFAYMNVAGCLRRRYYSLVKWALLSPVYWVLMSIAAWKGFLQLFYRPFYWEKTVHGLSNVSGLQAAGIEEHQ
ncbi:MAG: hypothetical protein AMXMBFR23_26060 [Chloroflexota bacterium]